MTTVTDTPSASTVSKTMAGYTFTKAPFNSNGAYTIREIACSGNMSAFLTGKFIKKILETKL